jgi:hypothetical protein
MLSSLSFKHWLQIGKRASRRESKATYSSKVPFPAQKGGIPVYFGVSKKPRSLLDIFSKKEPDLDPKLVAMLRCPITQKPLRYDALEKELIQDESGIVYHVVQGIPILTPSAATSLHNFMESDSSS